MKILYSKSAVKYIKSLDKTQKQRIKKAIEGLTESPPKGDIKLMEGYKDGRKRLRVGKYRIIYNYLLDGTIEVLFIMDIGSRGDIYK
ncbi:MAG: type II toxin-antitoxin system RelE/ParE family toxin [Clostridiales bacterium]|nr:type II toxin-antitoxin system RelE/ParE family toxin [Clostridiales bacterium]HIS62163.1 type II toxin-antitoxin system RelE/ParE family toxin [Candidatus Scybalomonas excrementigallinarum]